MQYLLLIYENEAVYGPEKGTTAHTEKHMKLLSEIGSQRIAAAGLKNTTAATTVRTVGGKQTIHDGPFAETREQLGGFYLIEAPDLDAALSVAKRIPLLKDGSIEVRPVLHPNKA
jgi:hypothetical protein